MEVAEVRQRVREAIERARRRAVDHRAAVSEASLAYEQFLAHVATPVFKTAAAALKAESYSFTAFTPAGGVRLMSDKSADDYIELELDTSPDIPTVLGRSNRARGRRMVTSERYVREGVPVKALTEEDVVAYLVSELEPFLDR